MGHRCRYNGTNVPSVSLQTAWRRAGAETGGAGGTQGASGARTVSTNFRRGPGRQASPD